MEIEKQNTLIIGNGEIGSSLFHILQNYYPCWALDIKEELTVMGDAPEKFDVIHICIRYEDNFVTIVNKYLNQYAHKNTIVDICTTVPVGTCELFNNQNICHSTTRGLHPNLVDGLLHIKKHIGGFKSKELKEYFEKVGIKCEITPKTKTTELLHILNNCQYGINVIFAQESYNLCRYYGVDFYEWMKYCETNNDGYIAMGMKTKVRPILMPPGNKIGGHCLVQSAELIPKNLSQELINLLSKYNN